MPEILKNHPQASQPAGSVPCADNVQRRSIRCPSYRTQPSVASPCQGRSLPGTVVIDDPAVTVSFGAAAYKVDRGLGGGRQGVAVGGARVPGGGPAVGGAAGRRDGGRSLGRAAGQRRVRGGPGRVAVRRSPHPPRIPGQARGPADDHRGTETRWRPCSRAATASSLS